ncbi:hypothetical protein BGX38DRAFT_780656 [Terfezia claveryi]|nr:hypothetical protein BGX38DRAFT_780656 [Terfezia claveryi]
MRAFGGCASLTFPLPLSSLLYAGFSFCCAAKDVRAGGLVLVETLVGFGFWRAVLVAYLRVRASWGGVCIGRHAVSDSCDRRCGLGAGVYLWRRWDCGSSGCGGGGEAQRRFSLPRLSSKAFLIVLIINNTPEAAAPLIRFLRHPLWM